MNRIIITGRLTSDPELKATNGGIEVCNVGVAVERKIRKDKQQKETDFFSCTAWGKTGVFVQTYFHKGDGITVEGRMESRKFQDKNGNNRTAWDLVVEQVEFPLGKGKSDSSNSDSISSASPEPSFSEIKPDEDLPF